MGSSVLAFWVMVAVLYFFLGVVSWWFSRSFSNKLRFAQKNQQMLIYGNGRKVESSPGGTFETAGMGTTDGEDDVVLDYWKDLRAYLDKVTLVNIVGFILAALAAVASYLSIKG